MGFKEKIDADLKEALKSGDALRVSVLRLLISAAHNRQIEKRSELSEGDFLDVVIKEEKKRREAAEAFLKGNRADLAEKENREAAILKAYLPPSLSEEEVVAAVSEIISRLGASSERDFGRVMGAASRELKGKAEAGLVAKIVKEKLS